MEIKRITCTGNYRKSEFFNVINSISNYFSKTNPRIDLILSDDFKNQVDASNLKGQIKIDTFSNSIENSDIVLSIGGDGTILSTIRRMSNKTIPVLGIHIGNLGFLAQSTQSTLLKALDCLMNKEYKIEERLSSTIRTIIWK